MLLWQSLLVLEGLDCRVIVVLVHFTVNSLGGFLMAMRLDGPVLAELWLAATPLRDATRFGMLLCQRDIYGALEGW